MEPPIGFIRPSDAVYMVGEKLFGSDWHPTSDWSKPHIQGKYRLYPATSRLFNSEAERVITKIAEWCEAGKIAAIYQTITGFDDLDRTKWRLPPWPHYFADGAIDLDLPLLDNGLRPNAKGDTVRYAREIFVRQEDIDRLIKTLPAVEKSKAGAPVEHDWDDYRQAFQQLWEQYGDFRLQQNQVEGWNSQAAAARKLLDYIQAHCDDGKEPHSKTVEDKVARWVKEIDSGA